MQDIIQQHRNKCAAKAQESINFWSEQTRWWRECHDKGMYGISQKSGMRMLNAACVVAKRVSDREYWRRPI